jgi:hypothetical protein
MKKVKVRWPGVMVVLTGSVAEGDTVEVDDELAAQMVADGNADYVEPKAKKTETATVKLKDKDA